MSGEAGEVHGALADGLAFATAVASERRLSDDAKVERMVTAGAVTIRGGRLVRRRAPHLAAVLTGGPRGIVVITRLPMLGSRVLSLRVPQLDSKER